MKINEIKDRMFSLSDLKGLIKEGVFEDTDWQGYFNADPKRREQNFMQAMGFKEVPSGPMTIDQFEKMGGGESEIRKHFGDEFFANILSDPTGLFNKVNGNYRGLRRHYDSGKRTLGGNQRKGGKSLQIIAEPNDTDSNNIEKPTTNRVKPIDALQIIFKNLGGDSIVAPETWEMPNIISYVERINEVADSAGVVAAKTYQEGITFFVVDDSLPGKEEVPFYFFLLFYYAKNCNKNGTRGNLTKKYIENVAEPNLREYTKYVLKVTPNVFDIILTSTINNLSKVSNELLINGFGTEVLSQSRASAYFKRYTEEYPGLFNEEYLKNIQTCFGFATKDILFDPIGTNKITDNVIGDGIRKWCNGGNDNAIKALVKPPINNNLEECSPIEKIFITARIIDGLLESNYNKFGTGPGKSKMTVGLLLEEGSKGIDYWNSMSRGGKIPKAQVQLRTMYDTEKSKTPSTPLPFWRILNLNNEMKDKTQGEIYYFLIGNSIPEVAWTYEYNRNKKIDSDLEGKSIDILGKTERHTFCFEYQGEQHYRPITVTYEEYTKFPLFTKMRERILTECGFIQKTVGGTKFFSGPETANTERLSEIKQIILDTYREFAADLSKTLGGKYNISSRLNETFSKLGKLNRGAKFEDDYQLLMYFQRILKESATSDVFEKAPMEDVVPYVGSPSRFLDEVKTAQDMGRDITKREIIKQKPGWILSYIIPSRATKDEEKYTADLAGNPNLVFYWNKEGKEKLLNFMQNSGILAQGVLEETLFQQIIKEIITD